MSHGIKLLVEVLAIIGAIAVAVVLAMWLMHFSMMGDGMMNQGAGR